MILYFQITTSTHTTIDAVSENLEMYTKLNKDFQRIGENSSIKSSRWS
jgi:hypothetical protein